jgi:TIR domain
MKHIFISYSHQDWEIADRLAADLRDANLSATYDKWMLRVGDSILEKVASVVSEAAYVIVLLSPWSVESNWVKKELSLAMASEVSKGGVTVLPAVIKDCNIPSMLADKLYANFQTDYFSGLYSLLETLVPDTYRRDSVFDHFRHKERVEADHAELSNVLMDSDAVGVKEWFVKHDYAVAAALLAYRDVGVVARFFINDITEVDFVVVVGGTIASVWLIQLGSTVLIGNTEEDATRDILRLDSVIQQWDAEEKTLRRLVALRMARPPFAVERWNCRGDAFPTTAKGMLLLGRRVEYWGDWGRFRRLNSDRWRGRIEIASYDRALDGLRQCFSGG